MSETHRSELRTVFDQHRRAAGSLAVFRPPEGGVNGRKMNLSRLVLSKIVLDLGDQRGEVLDELSERTRGKKAKKHTICQT